MSVELEGKLIQVLPEQTGEGRNGRWKRQEFVIETEDRYPRKILIQLWNDKANMIHDYKEGDKIKAHVNIESREVSSGKWFTNIKAWRLQKAGDESSGAPYPDAPMPGEQEAPPPSDEDQNAPDKGDDLPF